LSHFGKNTKSRGKNVLKEIDKGLIPTIDQTPCRNLANVQAKKMKGSTKKSTKGLTFFQLYLNAL